MKSYAGIGSRQTPRPILLNMTLFAETLSRSYILRTGGASGADSAFLEGVKRTGSENFEVYIPQNNFNGHRVSESLNITDYIPQEAYEMARKFHPKFDRLGEYAKKLMARNSLQVFGKRMDDPVEFIICYTSDGKASGGTGQALRIAEHYDITAYNLHNVDDFKYVKEMVNGPRAVG